MHFSPKGRLVMADARRRVSRVAVPVLAVAAGVGSCWYLSAGFPDTVPLALLSVAVLVTPFALYRGPVEFTVKRAVLFWAVVGLFTAYVIGVFVFAAAVLGGIALGLDVVIDSRRGRKGDASTRE